MLSRTRFVLSLATFVMVLILAPIANAEPLQIITQTTGFQLTGLGNNGTGSINSDALIGNQSLESHTVDTAGGTFTTVLNPLTFLPGFTGFGSGGTYQFNFSQLITVNGQTQILSGVGSLTISTFQDSISILSSEPLLFQFDTFAVSASVLPVQISGADNGTYYDFLCAQFVVTSNVNPDPVPEPATLLLLGTGLTGIAAKVRRRQKAKAES